MEDCSNGIEPHTKGARYKFTFNNHRDKQRARGGATACSCRLTAPFPVIVSEHLMENLAVSLARLNLPAFWRLKYRFQSQLNQTQVLFAKYLTHIFVISWERCACEDTRVPKNAVGTDTLSQWRHVVIPSSFLLTAFSPWFMTWRWNRVPQSTSEWTN